MVRTKQTTASGAQAALRQGELARFEPRNEAIPPNAHQCGTCDRRFSNQGNLKRHEKQTHGQALFKYPCPVSPQRCYGQRSDLREHYRVQHPEADIEEVDEVVVIEVPRPTPSTPRQPIAFEDDDEDDERIEASTAAASDAGTKAKRRKTKHVQNAKTTQESGHSSSSSAGLEPLSSSQIQTLAPGSTLKLIRETIKIEREYQFV